jgi:crossover junction endodeoxyribonuclease RuvC
MISGENIILGIDPGYGRVGIAIIENEKGNQKLIFSECFKTSAKESHGKRLSLIGQEISSLIKKYQPEAMAIENLFFHPDLP